MKKIVIESPCAGRGENKHADFINNFRYLLWCCRAAWVIDKHHAIASHMLNPWFMDDTNEVERNAGIDNPWVWEPGVEHWFFIDLGRSGGMQKAWDRIGPNEIVRKHLSLAVYAPEMFASFEKGEWPPHTPGFELKL